MPVKVEVTGHLASLSSSEFAQLEDGEIRRYLSRRATPVQASVTRGCPKRTTTLASTIRKADGRDALGLYVDIIVGKEGLTPYLGYILQGTPPHLIAPRNAKVLRFIQGGVVVFRTLVRHPGTKPNNFMERALAESFHA